ncbi:phosphomannomutase [Terrihabitans sp. B22-R8]|uniref:phosphomannomutase n=1 Tax=Terrihabitans sp. B22-R8 TaxID=3425128 RepID=UPI00403C73AD
MSGSSLKFGTSGLRGLVVELDGPPAYAYVRAFARMMAEDGAEAGSRLLIGRDLRASSPRISRLCARALSDSGFSPVDCGPLPTPALAFHAQREGLPAIMVTGSHIPEDRNGLKFYRPGGEITKSDEVRITALHSDAEIPDLDDEEGEVVGEDALGPYRVRYVDFFGRSALAGLEVGVYQHSGVARDLLVEVLEELGAMTVPLGRADTFIPVDTEALRPEDEALARGWASERRLDAIVSTDGDADRPLIADETGGFLRGDLVGAITAQHLGADVIVTPVTSNSALEASGLFGKVVRTRVGSPFVIEAMAAEAGLVLGFEANGGVLLGSDVRRAGHVLAALPTRDALLPILCALAEIAVRKTPLSAIAQSFTFKAAAANRVQDVASSKSAAFLREIEAEGAFREGVFAERGGVATLDGRDGLRLTLAGGDVVHFRASGNAPELRVYVEAANAEKAQDLLDWGLSTARRHTV